MKKLYNLNGKLVSISITRKICPVCFGVYEDTLTLEELDESSAKYETLSLIPVTDNDHWYTQFVDNLDDYLIVLGQYSVAPNGMIIRPGDKVLALAGEQVEVTESSCFEDYHDKGLVAVTGSSRVDDITCFYADGNDVIFGMSDCIVMDMACDHCLEMAEQQLTVIQQFGDRVVENNWKISPVSFLDYYSILEIATPFNCEYFTYVSGRWEIYRYVIDVYNHTVRTGEPFLVASHLMGNGNNYVLKRLGLPGYICTNGRFAATTFAKDNAKAYDSVGPVRIKESADIVILHKLRNCELSDESKTLLRRRVEEVIRKNPTIMLGFAASLAAENRINISDVI